MENPLTDIKNSLTWDSLAAFYEKKTGKNARTKPIEDIYKWALKQPEIKRNKDSSLSLNLIKK